jgi:hypothetical protein
VVIYLVTRRSIREAGPPGGALIAALTGETEAIRRSGDCSSGDKGPAPEDGNRQPHGRGHHRGAADDTKIGRSRIGRDPLPGDDVSPLG